MPICPSCSATIHTGAEDRCPACGYNLARANEIFKEGEVEFPRVLDGAGALTHRERIELLHALEDLERNIPPVALGIYITDNGKVQHLRTHAHWVLNHARIHHPSFGKREQRKAIEDAELLERKPGEQRHHYADVSPGLFERLWTSVKTYVRDAMHPLPPPVRQEWMLILVVDVQLEMACFTWGYKLDPYVNPDSINSCIVKARLQFRERAMAVGLRKVMKAAVDLIAIDAHKVNRRMRRSALPKGIRAMLLGALLLGCALPTEAAPARNTKKPVAAKTASKPTAKPANKPKPAAKPTPKPATKPAAKPTPKPAVTPKPVPTPPPALEDDDTAEEVEETPATPAATETTADAPAPATEAPAEPAPAEPTAPTPPPAPADSGASATYSSAPRWQTEHYRLLMAGELDTGYTSLFPQGDAAPATAAAAKSSTPVAKGSNAPRNDESDTQIPSRYCDAYLHPESKVTLCDPQKLLSTPETNDVAHVLRTLNADARYRICCAVFRGSQEIPAEMHASTLVGAVAQPLCEYAVLVVYPIGRPDAIDIGYREIKPDDAQRHAWLQAVREAAVKAGGGAEGLIAALRTVNGFILPLAEGFRAVNPDATEKAPLIEVVLKPKEEKKVSTKEKIRKALEDPANIPMLIAFGIVILIIGLALLWFFFIRRHVAVLLDSDADIRLGSPYGAGVSRYVRYLEGIESEKEKTLF